MKVKKKNETAEQPAPPKRPPVIEPRQQLKEVPQVKEFFYDYDVQEARNYQEVRFYFPDSWPNEVVVKKIEMDEKRNTLQSIIRIDESRRWKDSLTSPNKMSYQFFEAHGTSLELIKEVEVLPVLDIEIATELNLAQKYQLNSKTEFIYFHNLKMSPDAKLYFENYSGQIIVNSLQSEGGTFQTFPDDSKAPVGSDGRSGGKLKFEIHNAEGNLNILMLGERGGDGAAGRKPDDMLTGAKGADGAHAIYADLGTRSGGFNPDYTDYTCSVNPTDGADGAKGGKGYPGDNGFKGGNSGEALVYLNNTNLKLFSFSVAGLKGFGGAGGRGGAGGPGGAPGNHEFVNPPAKFAIPNVLKICERAVAGGTGPEGDYGSPGHEGRDGLASKNQLFINGIKSSFANEN